MASWHTEFFDEPAQSSRGRSSDFSRLLPLPPSSSPPDHQIDAYRLQYPRRARYVADFDESLFLASPGEDTAMSAGIGSSGNAVPGPGEARPAKPEAGETAKRPGILVVDDEPTVRQLLQVILTRRGFWVWQAASGEEALDTYQRHRDAIALVLLDVRMPGLSGTQTLGVLKELNPSILCCFMSGYLESHSPNELLAAGAAAVFAKPFEIAVFVNEIEKLVNTSKETRQC
jgi:CheY-like chemotaxis protein